MKKMTPRQRQIRFRRMMKDAAFTIIATAVILTGCILWFKGKDTLIAVSVLTITGLFFSCTMTKNIIKKRRRRQ